MKEPTLFPDERNKCVFSPARCFRYRLARIWNPLKNKCLFVMLNPSTADEKHTDPTVTRCIGYGRTWGCGGIEVCNIFAYRSTDPRLLYETDDPIGPDNDKHIIEAAEECDLVVAAWGDHGLHMGRGVYVLEMLKTIRKVFCLKKNQSGMPVHPLYQPANANLIPI